MAITTTTRVDAANVSIVDVIASADADVAAAVPHGLEVAPLDVTLVPLLPNFFTSLWTVGVVTATTINLVKANAVGSGDADAQVRVIARMPPDQTR